MSIPHGYGDKSGQGGGGYGKHQHGYGHPWHLTALVALGGSTRHDLGGESVTFDCGAAGVLPAGPFTVAIGGRTAYSGVSGEATDVYPDDTRRYFTLALPQLFGTLGAVDVVITHAGGVDTYTSVLQIVRHMGRTSSTMLAMRHPREVLRQPIVIPRT